MKFTNEDVLEIVRLLDATKYDELYLETERFKLTLRRRRNSGEWSQETQVLSAPNLMQSSHRAPGGAVDGAAVATGSSEAQEKGWIEVRAHLPGTFYRAPKPGAPPFVEIGSFVDKDSVVGILETMKLMNAVHAQASGEIVEICYGNAQFAEKDAVLMRIKPGAI
jgi:acetyl-CoA carboxylase biotin carboxyl carrier protein